VGKAERSDGDENIRQVSEYRHGGWRAGPSVYPYMDSVPAGGQPARGRAACRTAAPLAERDVCPGVRAFLQARALLASGLLGSARGANARYHGHGRAQASSRLLRPRAHPL
jgi:hypothetical protein